VRILITAHRSNKRITLHRTMVSCLQRETLTHNITLGSPGLFAGTRPCHSRGVRHRLTSDHWRRAVRGKGRIGRTVDWIGRGHPLPPVFTRPLRHSGSMSEMFELLKEWPNWILVRMGRLPKMGAACLCAAWQIQSVYPCVVVSRKILMHVVFEIHSDESR
jgi:hypothetical protein